jgi:hypothetical protein
LDHYLPKGSTAGGWWHCEGGRPDSYLKVSPFAHLHWPAIRAGGRRQICACPGSCPQCGGQARGNGLAGLQSRLEGLVIGRTGIPARRHRRALRIGCELVQGGGQWHAVFVIG